MRHAEASQPPSVVETLSPTRAPGGPLARVVYAASSPCSDGREIRHASDPRGWGGSSSSGSTAAGPTSGSTAPAACPTSVAGGRVDDPQPARRRPRTSPTSATQVLMMTTSPRGAGGPDAVGPTLRRWSVPAHGAAIPAGRDFPDADANRGAGAREAWT